MEVVPTHYPTKVYWDYIVDPSIMEKIVEDSDEKRSVTFKDYRYDNYDHNHKFIKEVCSDFLELNGFNHNKEKWYMDIIRYKLDNETKRVTCGLAWHCENDNYPDVITVLLYLRIDEGISDGNIRYKDKGNQKQVLEISSGTTVIMDGNVPHKPQDPYGTGIRDLVIVSFEK
jgi:hypothetical protein